VRQLVSKVLNIIDARCNHVEIMNFKEVTIYY